MVDRVQSSSFVDGPYNIFDDGLNSAASTIASIVSRQAFDIPWTARDSGGGDEIGSAGDDRRSAGGRFSLPDIAGPVDGIISSGVRARRDSIGSGVRARQDSIGSGVRARQDSTGSGVHHTRRDSQAKGRDPFGSPVTPQTYNGFRYGFAGNTRAAAAATAKTAAASG